MGCGSSAFPESPSTFLVKPGEATEDKRYVNSSLVDKGQACTVYLKKGLAEPMDVPFTIKKADGTEFMQVLPDAEGGRRHLATAQGDVLATLVFGMRYTDVNGDDNTFQHPHLILYTFEAYEKGQKPSEFLETIKGEDKPLFTWARIHKEPRAANGKRQAYQVALAAAQESTGVVKFSPAFYTGFVWAGARMTIQKGGKGEAIVTEATTDNECNSVSFAPNADPVLVIATIMTMEHLATR
jgi:hypothetical protein